MTSGNSENEKRQLFLSTKKEFLCKQDVFDEIPRERFGYWATSTLRQQFSRPPLSAFADTRRGLQTGSSETFIRKWFEVSKENADLTPDSTSIDKTDKWFLFNSGGSFRRWYGNIIDVVNWMNHGHDIKKTGKAIIPSEERYFDELISWNKISSGKMSVRYQPKGVVPGDASPFLHSMSQDHNIILYAMAVLNSKVAGAIVEILSPTLNFEVGNIAEIPFSYEIADKESVLNYVNCSIDVSKSDWDAYESSWDFSRHALISVVAKNRMLFADIDNIDLAECYMLWKQECEERFLQLKANEEELNRIFIDIYGLQEELTPDVADKDITVHRIYDTKKDVPETMQGSSYVRTMKDEIVSLLSYAVGCMFGRYSLSTEGLTYAGGEWDASKYSNFLPDEDNVIPITDQKYMDDDIVERLCEFLKVVYGEKSLETNLDFIANALGGKGATSREIIRNYFLNDFFKDHCKTYQKRPIYWLFDSGKQNGFKALVYMHRWDKNSIGRVLVYLHKIQEKYEIEVRAIDAMLEHMTDKRQQAAEEQRRDHLLKQIAEIKEYDEGLDHMTNEHIDIDLDDGVKVNYEKVQTDRNGTKFKILAPIK